MAIESTIEAADGWFAGEAKVLNYTLLDGDDATGWQLTWRLTRRRDDVAPLVTKTESSGVVGAAGFVTVAVTAADTTDLGGDDYLAELWRTDPGFEQLLAYGGAVIRRVARA